MARRCKEEEDELDAPSLSDLPDSPTRELKATLPSQFSLGSNPAEEFDFGRCRIHPEMCAAEDVFYRGRILPLRRSVDIAGDYNQVINSKAASLSRSESMGCNVRERQFVIQSDDAVPKPQLSSRVGHPTGNRQLRYVHLHEGKIWRKEKAGVWEFFRFGLIRNPEFQDLRLRNSDSRVRSRGMRKVHNEDCGNTRVKEQAKPSEQNKHGLNSWRRRPIASNCYCSDGEVKPSLQKQSTLPPISIGKKDRSSESKRELSRRRTDEWIKQLPRASCVGHEPLL